MLDVDRFTTYAALSVMLVDWDGYPLNREQLPRLFQPGGRPRGVLSARHGPAPSAHPPRTRPGLVRLVAWSVFSTDPGLALYEARCRQLLTNLVTLPRVSNLVEQAAAVLAPVQPDIALRASSFTDQFVWRLRAIRRDPFGPAGTPGPRGDRPGSPCQPGRLRPEPACRGLPWPP